jgi:PAS domain S-box-containing protein
VTEQPPTQDLDSPMRRAADAAALLDPLLTLSRELAGARQEAEVCGSISRALLALFPGRLHAVRLLDPRTQALTAFRASGPPRAGLAERPVLRGACAAAAGLDLIALAGGVTLAEVDEPLFDGSAQVAVEPLVVDGTLQGLINLEYAPGAEATPERDGPVLRHLAGQAALGVRNLRTVEELASLKTYLEQLIEHANALIAVVDRTGRVTVWNGALTRLTGVGAAEAQGRPLADYAVATEGIGLGALLDRTLAGEGMDGQELRLAAASGGEARVVFNTAPVRGPTGEIEGMVAIGQDLTRLRNLEAAAEQAEKMAGLGRLAAGIVHELNNPLVAVTMYSEALYEKWAFASGAAADLEKIKAIKEAGQRIHKLTRDLTAYARGGASKPEAADLGPLLDQAARMCKPALKEVNAEVERAFGEVPKVEASKAALVQCFVNLITNAAQALPKEGGVIRLGLAALGGQVVATVADGGAGMAREVAARAFEPFFTTRPGRGIGLGLATARGIVERHGGTISLTSEPGLGTTVTVRLPAKAPP